MQFCNFILVSLQLAIVATTSTEVAVKEVVCVFFRRQVIELMGVLYDGQHFQLAKSAVVKKEFLAYCSQNNSPQVWIFRWMSNPIVAKCHTFWKGLSNCWKRYWIKMKFWRHTSKFRNNGPKMVVVSELFWWYRLVIQQYFSFRRTSICLARYYK